MKKEVDGGRVRLYPSDWRYSATIVGLYRFLQFSELSYEVTEDYIEYDRFEFDDVYQKKYLMFVEDYFSEHMHHKEIEKYLSTGELSEEKIKAINEKMTKNSAVKSVFKGVKCAFDTADEIQSLIVGNREVLIEKTFATGLNLYAKYCNSNKLFSDSGEVCRLLGYYEDTGRKTKALSYHWNATTFVYEDVLEFDFIPFAFSKSAESFFINNNLSIKELIKVNESLRYKLAEKMQENERFNPRQLLFSHKETGTYLKYSVEMVTKKIGSAYFETLYVRDFALKIFESMGKKNEKNYEILTYPCKLGNDYIDIQKEVTAAIINGVHLDNLVELILKDDGKGYLLKNLIDINVLIYGGGKAMEEKLEKARKTAYAVKQNLEPNKLRSYRHKLISAVTFNDSDKFCKILLQLSDYSGVIFQFAYDLFDDFEANKNVAYAFVNGLQGEKMEAKAEGGEQ